MVKSNIKVMVVDGDAEAAAQVSAQLSGSGIEVVALDNGEAALEQIKTFQPTVILSEVVLEGMDGMEFCREAKRISSAPFIFLSEKAEVFDVVLGLEMGADDYIAKPYDPRELVARIKVAVRHMRQVSSTDNTAENSENKDVICLPGLEIDVTTYTVKLDGEFVDMPPKELQVLHMLAEQPNKVFTRDQLLERIWGYDFFGNSRTVDVHIKRIREKLDNGKEHIWDIDTVWGVGYKLLVKSEAAD